MYVHQDTPLGPGEGARQRTRVTRASALPDGRTERFGRLGLIARRTRFERIRAAKEFIEGGTRCQTEKPEVASKFRKEAKS